MTKDIERKLAAIMFTDIADFTALSANEKIINFSSHFPNYDYKKGYITSQIIEEYNKVFKRKKAPYIYTSPSVMSNVFIVTFTQ